MVFQFLRRRAPWLLISALISLEACGARAVEPARTFYVDFAAGSDQASGLSSDQAWRHAPGDSNAQGHPAQEALRPGDTVLFRGGVTYRGAIIIKASGEAGRPIVYRGEGFGPGKAIISGRDLVHAAVHKCAGQPVCAGLAHPDDLRILDLPASVTPSTQVALDGHLLELAQAPDIPDAFWYDDLAHYQAIQPDHIAGDPDGVTWRVQSDFLKTTLGQQPADDLILHLWRMPNAISSLPVDSYDPATSAVTLKADKLTPYTKAQSFFAIANHPALIRRPYQFATIDHGARIVVNAPLAGDRADLEVSTRGVAFTATGQKHVAIEGFEILGFAGGSRDWGAGTALLVMMRGAEDIAFRRNDVHDLTSWSGASAVTANGVAGVTVSDNRFVRMWRGGGVGVGLHASDVRIQNNLFDHIGRTGVAVIGAERVWIDRNVITDLFTVHANGIAVYLDNRDVLVSNNLIRNTPRAITFQGGPEANGLTIRHNLLWGQGREGSAIQSWGRTARGVVIEGNVLAVDGGPNALKLNASDAGVTVRNNLIGGLLIFGAPPADWVIQDNIYSAANYGGVAGPAGAYDAQNKFKPNLAKAGTDLLKGGVKADQTLCRLLTVTDSDQADAPPWLPTGDGAVKPTRGIGPAGACSP